MLDLEEELNQLDTSIFDDGLKAIWINIILRAQQDFIDYRIPKDYAEFIIFKSAEEFLFSDKWSIVYNTDEFTLEDICQFLGYSARGLRQTFLKFIESDQYEIPQLNIRS